MLLFETVSRLTLYKINLIVQNKNTTLEKI